MASLFGNTAQNHPIGIEEVSNILSVSTATIRNWIKSGKFTTVSKQGRSLVIDKSEVLKLRLEIESGESHRLKSRRNKRAISGKYIPIEYVESTHYVNVAEKILALIGSREPHTNLNLMLFEVALNVFNDIGHIHIEKVDSSNLLSLTELVVMGNLKLHSYEDIFIELYNFKEDYCMPSDLVLLRSIRQLNIKYYQGDDLLGLVYMSLSNLGTRKNNGSYYTSSSLVDSLVKTSMEIIQNVECPKIIDPCCGSGNFLVRVFIALRSKLIGQGLTLEDAERRLQKDCIFGYDIDQTAVILSKINIALVSETTLSSLSCLNIEWRNTLENSGTMVANHNLERFDLVIGNPPWGYSFTREEIDRLKDQFVCGQASLESFCLFIEYGVRALRPNGILAYVLPESLLNVQIHTSTRKFLLDQTKIRSIALLGHQFSKVFSPTILLVVEKNGTSSDFDITVESDKGMRVIPQNRFFENDTFIFNVLASNSEDEIVEHMKCVEGAMFLKNNASFALGIVTGNNTKYLFNENMDGAEIVVRGSDVFKYNFYATSNFLTFNPDQFQQVAPVELYRSPEKLIYRFINESLVFSYDHQGSLSLNSANIVIPCLPGYSIKYVLAVLNSRFAQFFHSLTFSSVKVLRKHVESIPIPPCTPNQQNQVIDLVDQLIASDHPASRLPLYNQIDNLVADLYRFTSPQKSFITRKYENVKFLSKS